LKGNPLFYCTKFGEEFEFKVRYGSSLGYSFLEKKKERKDHEQRQRNGKIRKRRKKPKESVSIVVIVR